DLRGPRFRSERPSGRAGDLVRWAPADGSGGADQPSGGTAHRRGVGVLCRDYPVPTGVLGWVECPIRLLDDVVDGLVGRAGDCDTDRDRYPRDAEWPQVEATDGLADAFADLAGDRPARVAQEHGELLA